MSKKEPDFSEHTAPDLEFLLNIYAKALETHHKRELKEKEYEQIKQVFFAAIKAFVSLIDACENPLEFTALMVRTQFELEQYEAECRKKAIKKQIEKN